MTGSAFNRLKSGFIMEQASSAILGSATSGLGACKKELHRTWVGKHPFVVTQVLALSPFGMVGSGQVWQKLGKAHMLPRWVGRQSEFAPNPLPGCPPLAPSAQGEELPMHQFSSLEVEAKDDACRRKMARNTILQ